MEISNYKFRTKNEVISYLKDVLANYKSGDILTGKPFFIADGVFRMHLRYKIKTRGRSYKICIEQCHINRKNNKFMVCYEDGDVEDFSFYKALSYPSIETRVKAALRRIIESQTTKYKTEYFHRNQDKKGYIRCQSTGLKINIKECHLDHYPMQFDEIVQKWAKGNDIDLRDIELKYSDDENPRLELEDCGLALSFYAYHESMANYRLVLAKVNLQREKYKANN